MKPIFILSSMRSGSTLLQRALSAHSEVATVSEPWLLLPLIYARRRRGIAADYEQPILADALSDFCDSLPDGERDYDSAIHRFALDLYGKAATAQGKHDAAYFLDKTPPYYAIVDDLRRIFPEAKMIYLWRNPLAIIGSMIEWFGPGWDPRWGVGYLLDGLPALTAAHQRDATGSHALRFEDLVVRDPTTWRSLYSFLDLDHGGEIGIGTGSELKGRMGDSYGTARYSEVSTEPLEKWRAQINSPVRTWWTGRILSWLGSDVIESMGYDLVELQEQLGSNRTAWNGLSRDSASFARACAAEPLQAALRRRLGLSARRPFRPLRPAARSR